MRKLLALALCGLLWCGPALAAISFDNSNSTQGTNTTVSVTQVTSASATLAVVVIDLPAGGDVLTSATVSGVAYTGLTKQAANNGTGYSYFIWWLNPPAGGTNSIAANFSASVFYSIRTASYIGVANQAPVTSVTPTSGAVTTFTTNSATPCASGSWVIGFIENSTAGMSAGTGTFYREGAGNGDGIFDTNGTVSGATSLQATTSPAEHFTGMIGAFSPTVCTAGSPHFILPMSTP